MEITRTAAAGHVGLKLKGRLDAIWSDHVGRALDECVQAGEHVLTLDMSEVDYMSSAGIRVLMIYTKKLRAIQGRLVVVNASEVVRSVLQLAGLGMLLEGGAGPVAPASERPSLPLVFPQPGTAGEIYELNPNARLQVDCRGDSAAWLEGRTSASACTSVEFPAEAFGLGLGALGADRSTTGQRLGEFLAAGGAAVCQPADGTRKPDYMLLQGSLTPTVQMAYGLLARGGFSRLLRFDKGPQETSVPLSVVVQACLETCGGAIGMVMVAETAALVGAALQKTPGARPGRRIFDFPDVRDWLSFTAEAAFASTTCLIVGLAADEAHASRLQLLRPLVQSGRLYGHFHAAAFPYRPLRKGRIDLAATVSRLFDGEQVLGLLHLLNDWRSATGAGESRLLRGACWCGAIEC